MTPLEVLRDNEGKRLRYEDEPLEMSLLPGLANDEIDTLAKRLPAPLPTHVRDLLAACRGVEGLRYEIDFSGESMEWEMAEAFPSGHPIASDGAGNFWVVDLRPDSTDWGPIYYASHDAPVILYQSPDLSAFLQEVFRGLQPPNRSLVEDVREDRIRQVWAKNPLTISHGDAVQGDDELRQFAQGLDASWEFTDLRNAVPGDGFSWGRYGPRTEVLRHGYLPIFAIRAEEKKPGFLARLFGRN